MRRIVLISHDDTLSGAPKLLLYLANLLYSEKWQVSLVIKNYMGTGLIKLKGSDYPVICLNRLNRPKTFINYLFGRLERIKNLNSFKRLIAQSDVVINNTTANYDLSSVLKKYGKGRVMSYIHELDGALNTILVDPGKISLFKKSSDHYLVPCKYVGDRLRYKFGFSEDQVSVLNYYIPLFDSAMSLLTLPQKKNDFWVGMCGNHEVRKGIDVFIRMAEYFSRRYAEKYNIKFFWLGMNGHDTEFIKEDCRKLKIADIVYFIPPAENPASFFYNIDVLALTSREDPYPLVALEAAQMKKPIIFFDQSGGIVDFLDPLSGIIIPFMDIEKYVEAIINLYDNRSYAKDIGNNAYERYMIWHQDRNLILSQFNNAISQLSL